MRILMAITQYAPAIGGAESQAKALSEGLAERGHRIVVLTQPFEGAPEEETIGGARVVRRMRALRLGPLWGLTHFVSAWRLLGQWLDWADAVHCHQAYFHSAAAALRRRPGGPPAVCKILTAGPQGDLARMRARPCGKAMLGWMRRFDRMIAICEPIARELLQAGFAADRIARIPNFVDTARFLPALREKESGEWLFAGRLHERKGADALLRAIAMCGTEAPGGRGIRLAIAGDGPQRTALEALANELGLAERVRFLGSRADPRPLYAASRGVALPSRGEGLSNVMLEAMAMGKCVVATDVGGAREALDPDGALGARAMDSPFAWARAGMLARSAAPEDLAAALAEAESAPERRRAVGDEAIRRIANRYAKDAALDIFEVLYQDLARSASREGF
ncbi:MAG: Glycogen synthase [candidate division BRC1 bacterium ADurb.BinA364]|nr:MAG: Glycogen synthase [candidate division BRC1 bacterium ADurb.BinA364]